MDFDDILSLIGDFGLYQKYIYFIAVLSSILAGIHMLANVFTMAVPLNRCFVDGCDSSLSTYQNQWSSKYLSYSSCEQLVFNTSSASFSNISCVDSQLQNTTTTCYSWIYDKSEYELTTVTEWNMVCSQSWTVSTSESIFMCGNLVGSFIFGTIGDKYGRRLIFLVAPIIWASTAFATAFSNNWIVYTVLKFLTAACLNGVYATLFVVVVEFIGVSKRAWCGNMIQVFFAVGELILAGSAYYIRNWRDLQLAISVPLAFLLFLPCFIPESVRWQLSNSKYNDAKHTILKAAKRNKKIISDDTIDELIQSACFKAMSTDASAGFLQVLKSPILLRRSCNIFFNWLVNSLVYYGLSMSASNLGGNSYVNFLALAAVEIPAVILATYIQQWKGRRIILCSVMLLGGASCMSAAFIPQRFAWLITSLAVFGKSNIAASFAVIYIYSAEIFPTTLRNSGIGISSMCSRIGGILAPVVADLGHYNKMLPMIIFGGSSIAAGLLSLALPETHNQKLPENIAEAERFGRKPTQKLIESEEDNISQRVPLLDQLEWS